MADVVRDPLALTSESTPPPKVSSWNSDARTAKPTRVDLVAMQTHGEQQECTAFPDREKPLELLDLPNDVLQNILHEITHTNDLTSLALTHSALHDLAIPQIYSRFDIVWPDGNANSTYCCPILS